MTSDRAIKCQTEIDGGKQDPEARIVLVPIGGVLLTVGLFCCCWTAQYNLHWIVLIIWLGIIGLGSIMIFAASALATDTLVRSSDGGFLALAGLTLYKPTGSLH